MNSETAPGDLPATSAEEKEDAATQSASWAPKRSRRNTIVFSLVILAGVLAILFAWGVWPFRSTSQTTDNAFVRGKTTIISPQVGGYVTEVLVRDFEDVKAGQPLVRIDDRIYRQRVSQSEANIANQEANLQNADQSQRSSEAQVRLQDAALASARAQLVKAQADMRRIDELVSEGSVSIREQDQVRAALRQAEAAVNQAEAQREIAVQQTRSVNVGRGGLRAQVENATAARDLARIDLENTMVRAPNDGRLSEVAVRLGQFVQPGAQLMFLVPRQHWIVANFKEAQTVKIRVGQPATVRVDALGRARLTGKVENISPAAGSEFSVLRPDTGAGNFVKVPQRIAVRIRLDPGQSLAERLGPGMSVIATVHTSGAE